MEDLQPSFVFPQSKHSTQPQYFPLPQNIQYADFSTPHIVIQTPTNNPHNVVTNRQQDDVEQQPPACKRPERHVLVLSGPLATAFPFFLWYTIITLTAGVGATLAIAYTNHKWDKYKTQDWISLIVSFAPLIGLEITLGIPSLWNAFKASFVTDSWISLFPWAALISSTWVASSALYGTFNPLSLAFIFATAMGTLGSLQFVGQAIGTSNRKGWTFLGGLTFVDVALWCLLFIPLDYRWYDVFYWFGPDGMDYDYWALVITLLGVIGWGLFRDLPGFGYRLVPKVTDFLYAAGAIGILGLIVVPLGLLSGFLQWPPAQVPSFWQVFSLWLENVLTIAITEELFFRVVIMNGINVTVKDNKNGWVGLLISSFCFGLMHWPRRNGEPIQQLIYASLAFVSGILYGQAYRLSGNNILAAVLTHSLTDTCWAFLFTN